MGVLAVAGCGHPQQVIAGGTVGVNGRSGSILLRDVRVAAPPDPQYPAGSDADVWLVLLNEGSEPDALTGVSSPAAGAVAIRRDAECDGTATTVPSLPLRPQRPKVPTGASPAPSAASPFGAYHLRLTGLTRDVPAGTSVDLTFRFREASPVTLSVPVRPRQAQDAPGHLCTSSAPMG